MSGGLAAVFQDGGLRFLLRLLPLLSVMALLAACTTLPPVEEGEGRRPDDVDHFTLEGKVGWSHPEGRGSASLTWRQAGADFSLLLTGPMGQGAVRLQRNADGVRLDTPEGPRYAQNADLLLAETLGFTIPVEQARWWVLGIGAPEEQAGPLRVRRRDEYDRPVEVEQNGWQIEWSDRRLLAGRALPRRVRLEHAETRLTLVVGAWTLPDSSNESGLPTD